MIFQVYCMMYHLSTFLQILGLKWHEKVLLAFQRCLPLPFLAAFGSLKLHEEVCTDSWESSCHFLAVVSCLGVQFSHTESSAQTSPHWDGNSRFESSLHTASQKATQGFGNGWHRGAKSTNEQPHRSLSISIATTESNVRDSSSLDSLHSAVHNVKRSSKNVQLRRTACWYAFHIL